MSETYHLPDSDPFQVEEAKRLANRILRLQTNHPGFRQGIRTNDYFWLRCSSPTTNDEIVLGYFPKATVTWDDSAEAISLLDAPIGFDFPAITFSAHHNGLYHSVLGLDLPKNVWSDNRVLYSVSNNFVFNQAGQAYREDKLEPLPGLLSYVADCPDALYIKRPEESDLGTHINALEAGDYEMIGHYLNRIEQT